eukprot:707873-Rhodomonas_salina.1
MMHVRRLGCWQAGRSRRRSAAPQGRGPCITMMLNLMRAPGVRAVLGVRAAACGGSEAHHDGMTTILARAGRCGSGGARSKQWRRARSGTWGCCHVTWRRRRRGWSARGCACRGSRPRRATPRCSSRCERLMLAQPSLRPRVR